MQSGRHELLAIPTIRLSENRVFRSGRQESNLAGSKSDRFTVGYAPIACYTRSFPRHTRCGLRESNPYIRHGEPMPSHSAKATYFKTASAPRENRTHTSRLRDGCSALELGGRTSPVATAHVSRRCRSSGPPRCRSPPPGFGDQAARRSAIQDRPAINEKGRILIQEPAPLRLVILDYETITGLRSRYYRRTGRRCRQTCRVGRGHTRPGRTYRLRL